jgi:hypothetical protein
MRSCRLASSLRFGGLALLAVAGCTSDSRPPESQNTNRVPTWQIAQAPTSTIRGGNPDSAGFVGRVDRAWYDPTSQRITIIDGKTTHIHVFDAKTGAHVMSFARQGKGPGEVDQFSSSTMFGDDLYSYDTQLGRMTHWKAGKLVSVRSVPRYRETDFSSPFVLDGGRVMYMASEFGCMVPGRVTNMTELILADTLGANQKSLGKFASATTFNEVQKNGACSGFGIPLGANWFVTPVAGGVWISEGVRPEVRHFSSSGDPSPPVKLPFRVAEVTSEDRQAYDSQMASYFPNDPKGLQRNMARVKLTGYADSLPAVTGMVGTTDGGVWVEKGASTSASTRTWYVVSRQGSVKARVEIEKAWKVLDASDSHVLVSREDQNGDVSVSLFEIRH